MLASLALHALILLCLASYRHAEPARMAPPPLTAHLKPKPPPEPPKVELPPPQPLARSIAKPQPRLVPVQSPAPVLAMEPQKQSAESPAFVVPAAPPQAAAPAQASARADLQPAASGPDSGSIARFRLELMEIARRYKRYPRIAQDNNWEGRVELRIVFAENGAMTSVTVKKGAGRAVLDEAAQAMIRSAQAQASVPPSLRGHAFTLEIPVDFSLKDER